MCCIEPIHISVPGSNLCVGKGMQRRRLLSTNVLRNVEMLHIVVFRHAFIYLFFVMLSMSNIVCFVMQE